jgi:hypothetical protein
MEEVLGFVRALGLDPALIGAAAPVAWLLRLARGAWLRFDTGWTLLSALASGLLLAGIHMAVGAGWRGIAEAALSYAAVIMVIEEVLRKWAEKGNWPILPRDNALTQGGQK